MNGSAHRQRPNTNKRLFDGRLEKRLATSVPVYLASFGEPRVRERTVTENISPHGASVISQRPWRSGEEALIAPSTGEFPQVGTVVYSRRKNGGGRLDTHRHRKTLLGFVEQETIEFVLPSATST